MEKTKKQIRVTLVRSSIGSKPVHRKTLKALGLRRINSSVVHNTNDAIMGMVRSVIHLVRYEEIS